MFVDTRQVADGSAIETTVCIIGGGVAGIAIAREMEKHGIDTCLLESGGLEADDETRDLYRGENVGIPYSYADGCRSRFLGGSSNCWGGWCRPLDAWDFTERDWIPYSGWPFGMEELEPYYRRTHALLKLGPYDYDPAFWERSIGRPDARRLPMASGKVHDTISQFSPPARLGELYREELKHARARVFLYANVVNIDTDATARTVSKVDVVTLTGRRITVAARRFVLATGGIENARLMLASNKVQRAGLGNGNDLVGRFFMEHPRIFSGRLRLAREWSRNRLYDGRYHNHSAALTAHGTAVASQLSLLPEVLEKERLLNARVWFSSILAGEETDSARALYRVKRTLARNAEPDWHLPHDLVTILTHPVDTASYAVSRIFRPRAMVRGVQFQLIVEPAADPSSRVTLATANLDRLGMPRVRVDWRLTDQVRRTFDRTLAIVGEELRRSGTAEVNLDPPIEGGDWPASFEREGTWHHMGTTRMHASPRQGVVDANSRVHRMSNLYVAGSSVFPTAGANYPTITLAALALRLSDHLAGLAKAG
jgi:choline dehydrogenase-like flavoprotein